MPRSVAPAVDAHLGDRYSRIYELVELIGASTTYRFTNAPVALSWNGHTWDNRSFTTSEMTQDGDGEISGSVTFEDVSRTIRSLAFSVDLNAFAIRVLELWIDEAGTPYGEDLIVEGACDGVRCEGEDSEAPVATIAIRGYYAASSAGIGPTQEYTRTCRYRQFKGPECKYAGAGASCDRQFATCSGYANTANFGGFRFALGAGDTIQWGDNDPAPIGERPSAAYEPPPPPSTGTTTQPAPPRTRAARH